LGAFSFLLALMGCQSKFAVSNSAPDSTVEQSTSDGLPSSANAEVDPTESAVVETIGAIVTVAPHTFDFSVLIELVTDTSLIDADGVQILPPGLTVTVTDHTGKLVPVDEYRKKI